MFRYLYKVVIIIPLDIYPEMGVLCHMIALFLISEQTPSCYFTNGCTKFIPPTMVKNSFSSPNPHQHLWSLVLFIVAFLTDVRWYLIMILICISLKMRDAEHLFMCLLANRHIWIFSLKKCLFKQIKSVIKSLSS